MNDEEGKLEDERIDEITQKQEFDQLQVGLYFTVLLLQIVFRYFVPSSEPDVREILSNISNIMLKNLLQNVFCSENFSGSSMVANQDVNALTEKSVFCQLLFKVQLETIAL